MSLTHTCSAWKNDWQSREECRACRAQDSIKCTCPPGWFPAHKAFILSQLPHRYAGGTLAHHPDCAKAKT